MSAYALFDNVEVHDAAGLEIYKSRVQPVVERYGGRYVVLGGSTEIIEGDWHPRFLVMIEFPSLEDAQRWYASPDYEELKAIRQSSVRSNGVLIGGLSSANP